MAIEYRNPSAVSVLPTFNGAENVVCQVTMTCFNTDNGRSTPFTISWGMDDFSLTSDFVNFEDVTDENLIAWAKAGAGPDMISALEEQVTALETP